MKVLVTGAGLSGTTAAVLLSRAGHEVEVLDIRGHAGGNCHDEQANGVTVHKYGPHLFHTENEAVWRFLSRYTAWTDYRHEVMADTRLGRLSIPWSRVSMRQAGCDLSGDEIRNLIFADYSEKQWGVPFSELPDTIRNRVPLQRDNEDTRYFTDRFQGQPADGYAPLFTRMLEGIPVHTGVAVEEWRKRIPRADLHVYTGKVDAFFGYSFGRLPYRSLRFDHVRSRIRLPHAVINQCNRLPYTRVYDHAWWLGETPQETVITREYPQAHDETNDPFYPMPFGPGREIHQQYKKLADTQLRTIFSGRLATYRYLDMWMAVAQIITLLRPLLGETDRQDLVEDFRGD